MNRDAPDHAVRIALIDLNGGVPNRAIALLRHKLRGAGLKIVDFDPRVDGRLPNGSVDALLLTGGPGDPLAPEQWRRRLQTSLAASRLPVLGICLGFQVLAAAHGWRLQLVDQPRFGLIGLRPTAAGRRDPLFAGLAPDAVAFEQRHWGARPAPGCRGRPLLLAPDGEVLAIRFGSRSWGTVFHPEADPAVLESWLRDEESVRHKATERGGPDAVLRMQRQLPRLQSTWDTVLDAFLATLRPRGAGVGPRAPWAA